MKFRYVEVTLIAVASLALNAPTNAQTQRSGGSGEAQKFMQQYQQLAGEKTALQAQLAQMKKDLDAANAQLAAVKKERDAAKAHVGISPAALTQANGQKDAAERNLEKSKVQINELVTKFRGVALSARDIEGERNKLREDLAKRERELDKAADDNMQLYEINADLLDRYDRVGLFTRASASEPFTKLTRTRIDNLVIEYRQRAEALRIKRSEAAKLQDASRPAETQNPRAPTP